MVTKLDETPQGSIALAFAHAIAARDYELAHSMLSASLQVTTSATQLAEDFDAMIDYAECPPEVLPDVELMQVVDQWPDKKDEDVGWAYVALSNNYYSEAITVIVAHEQEREVVRELEWGRP